MSAIYEVSADGRVCCIDCGRWVHASEGGQVVHSSRCDHSADATSHRAGAPTLDQSLSPTCGC